MALIGRTAPRRLRDDHGAKGGEGSRIGRRPIKVFISYRHEDSDANAQSICEAFAERFGKDCVFFDVDQEPGRFVENIKRYMKHADVLVSMIGKRWVDLRTPPEDTGGEEGEEGLLWSEEDNVRLELRLALELRTELVPVFVDGVNDVPGASELPEDLRPLRAWNGYTLVPRATGNVPYRQGLEHICNMVEWAALRRRDAQRKARVEKLVEQARKDEAESDAELRRTLLEQAKSAADEIDDEMLREEAFEELEPELGTLEKQTGSDAREKRDQGMRDQVRELVAGADEAVKEGRSEDAKRALASAEEAAHEIEDDQVQKEAFSDVAEAAQAVSGGEGRIRELIESTRRLVQAGQFEEAGATAAFAEETAQGIESGEARRKARAEVAKLAEEVRVWRAAAERGAFDAATELAGARGSTRGSNTAASKEPGEPDHAGNGGGSSVWYRWTAPEEGTATIDTFGSDFDTLLAVYRGAGIAELEPVAENDDIEGAQSRVRFPVRAGDSYRIAVDGYGGTSGNIVLSWEIQGPPPNDAFDDAEELAGTRGSTPGRNTAAGKEPAEPDHAGNGGGSSVWYRWIAPEDGTATIDTFGSDFDTLLAVYRGAGIAELEPVAENDDTEGAQSRVRFPVRAGDSYRIAVDGYGGTSGNIVLSWEIGKTPPVAELVRATGFRFRDASDGSVAVPFAGQRADQVVVDGRDVEDGFVFFSVELPEFTGFGTKTFLRTLLSLSYAVDYVKAMRLPGDHYGLGVAVDATVLTPTLCEGFIQSLVALGDVKDQSELIGSSWDRRRAACGTAQDQCIHVDPDGARRELAALAAQMRAPVEFSVATSNRVISLIVTLEGVKPGRSKDKLRGLLGLNAGMDVAKIGLDAQGQVVLLYEVPQVTPDVVERASAQLASLRAMVTAVV